MKKHVNPYTDKTSYTHPDTFVNEKVTLYEECVKSIRQNKDKKSRCRHVISGLEHDLKKLSEPYMDVLCPSYKLEHIKDELKIWYEYRNRVYSAKEGENVDPPEGTIYQCCYL